MKKLVFVIVLILSSNLLAQSSSFGVKAGFNFSTFDTDESDNMTSYHIGALYDLPLSDVFSFQPEVLYSRQGAKAKSQGNEAISKLDYLKLPLMVNYTIIEGLKFELGPELGFLLNDELTVKQGGAIISAQDTLKEESVMFNVNAGVSYELNNGLMLQTRYSRGLIEVYEGTDTKNNVISLSLGYKF